MKILLTGATGFIGKHIYAKLLESNVALHMISRKPQEHLKNCQVLDILNLKYSYTLIKNLKPDTLIHLAWDVSHGDFWNSEKNNDYAQATIHLFETFIKYGGNKIISTGSCAEYPTSCQAVSENQDYEGTLTAYGTAKKQVATYLESKKKYIDFTWCRIFGIFGPGENSKRLFPSIISSIKEKKSFPIDTPEVFYDYVYIKTFSKLILSCINKKGMGIVNIGTGNSLSIFDIYRRKYFHFKI